MKHSKKHGSRLFSTVVSTIAMLAIIAIVTYGIASAAQSTNGAGAKIAEESIRRAAVSCYALEGVYPPNYTYLREHYGVRVDETRYAIVYEVFGSNMMPQITVIPLG